MKPKVLFVRLDRIGDLVLTLPVDQMTAFKGCLRTWLIWEGLDFIVKASDPKREFQVVGRSGGILNFFLLVQWLRRERFDGICVFHAPWWMSIAAALSGARIRSGVRSQWHSYLLLPQSLRQKRSRGDKHELDYNAAVALHFATALALGDVTSSSSREAVPSPLKLKAEMPKARANNDWVLPEAPYFVVHPGMGGSARNWPISSYIAVIERLSEDHRVVITGTRTDAEVIQELKTGLKKEKNNVLFFDEKLSGAELLWVLGNAQGVLAPSTGVLHLAASLGTPTLGIFSPVHVQSPKRWGPRGSRVKFISPNVKCPATFDCLGSQCSEFDCMNLISSQQTVEALLEMRSSSSNLS